MPICSVAPSSINAATCWPIASSTGEGGVPTCSCSGRSVWTNVVTLENGTSVLPCVRGMRSLISATIQRADNEAASAASTDVPKVQ